MSMIVICFMKLTDAIGVLVELQLLHFLLHVEMGAAQLPQRPERGLSAALAQQELGRLGHQPADGDEHRDADQPSHGKRHKVLDPHTFCWF
jgi:hypothetical protein